MNGGARGWEERAVGIATLNLQVEATALLVLAGSWLVLNFYVAKVEVLSHLKLF